MFICRDGTIRDLASIHGTYRKVEETIPAITIIAHVLDKLSFSKTVWLLDEPVANSGRLKKRILAFAQEKSMEWDVQLVPNPDKVLIESQAIIVTSDSAVLDRCKQWLNLAGILIDTIRFEYDLNLLDMRTHSASLIQYHSG